MVLLVGIPTIGAGVFAYKVAVTQFQADTGNPVPGEE
jgi:ABC-type phosphate transport system permease subunit